MTISSLRFSQQKLELLDIRGLPDHQNYQEFAHVSTVAQAIRDMVIVGPTIVAAAAAYALTMEAQRLVKASRSSFFYAMEQAFLSLRAARPACKSLSSMLDRLHAICEQAAQEGKTPADIVELFQSNAERFVKTAQDSDAKLAQCGAAFLKDNAKILTTGGTGLLSSVGVGSALGIIREAARMGKEPEVFCTMSRPLQLGRRMTEPELKSAQIKHRVISDASIGYVLENYSISCVLIGATTVVNNGDVVASAGSSLAATVAKRLGIDVYVAIQDTVVDVQSENTKAIPMEELQYYLDPGEETIIAPLFDTTPAECITAYITKYGVFRPREDGPIRALLPSLL